MITENPQIIKINNKGWYVETRIGFDGPFESINEAMGFLDLIKSSNAARDEFAGLQYTPVH